MKANFLVRQKSKNYFVHLIMPLLGLSVAGFAFFSLDKNALTLGCVWLVVGLIYMLYLKYIS
jgi:hypothetical protein